MVTLLYVLKKRESSAKLKGYASQSYQSYFWKQRFLTVLYAYANPTYCKYVLLFHACSNWDYLGLPLVANEVLIA